MARLWLDERKVVTCVNGEQQQKREELSNALRLLIIYLLAEIGK